MAAELSGAQNCILRGPGWSGQDPQARFDPLDARINVACVSTKTTNRKLSSSFECSTEPVIQVSKLAILCKSLNFTNPNGKCIVKVQSIYILHFITFLTFHDSCSYTQL